MNFYESQAQETLGVGGLCSWMGFALWMLILPAVRMMGHALGMLWAEVECTGAVSSALIILSTVCSQFSENQVFGDLWEIYLVCICGCRWKEKQLDRLLRFFYSLLTRVGGESFNTKFIPWCPPWDNHTSPRSPCASERPISRLVWAQVPVAGVGELKLETFHAAVCSPSDCERRGAQRGFRSRICSGW